MTALLTQQIPQSNRLWAAYRQLAFELANNPPEPSQPPAAYQIALLLRESRRWDGVSPLRVLEAPTLWRALQRGEISLGELEEGSHYLIERAAK